MSDYHKNIVEYYEATENAYKDAWDLNKSLAIHFGYWDEKVTSFPGSLLRMNEVMIEKAKIVSSDKVLDAGCGVGGSSIFIAAKLNCQVTGITLSDRQVEAAIANAKRKNVNEKVDFKVMDYCATSFPGESFDVVWACESICYASDKEQFVKEAFRLLKPGGRLIVADGFVTGFLNNQQHAIRTWLDGWQVNYLESPDRFKVFMEQAGFTSIEFSDISKFTQHSSRRLLKFYFLASLYVWWKKLTSSKKPTEMQKKNIKACWYQYWGMKRKLWQYAIILGTKK